MNAAAGFDHLVIAAATLEAGEDHLEELLGVRPRRGGKHVAMGTHNSLLKLGDRAFVEVIAVDPDAASLGRPRWFALDEPAMREALAERPRLIHWVARCDDIETARRASPVDVGPALPMERGSFRWRITIPDDGHLPGRGVLPTLIQWSDARHPADGLPESSVRLAALSAAHPDPARIRPVLAALGLAETLKVTFGVTPRLAALLRTPHGPVTL
ncbi:MAG TPA: VOC family protein [Casimicrobiaceae bacterium]